MEAQKGGTVTTELRRAVLIVAVLNLSYFGVEFAVATAIGSASLFADSIDFLEDTSVNLLIAVALGWSTRRLAKTAPTKTQRPTDRSCAHLSPSGSWRSKNTQPALRRDRWERVYCVEKTETRRLCGTVGRMAKSLQAQRYKQLPAMLREMREKAGLTQRDLAKKLRIDHVMIHNSETAERRVDVAEFADWAEACGVDPVESFKDLQRKRGK